MRHALVFAVATALVAASCGSGDPAATSPATVPSSPITVPSSPTSVDPTEGTDGSPPVTPGDGSRAVTSTTIVAGDRGWVGGEPDWHGGAAGASGAGDAASASDSAEAAVLASPSVGVDERAAGAGDDVAPLPSDDPIRAGSVDDNEDFGAFLDYLDRIRDLGIQLRDLDPSGMVTVSVVGDDGRPVAGARVTVAADGADVASIETTADGTARFLPGLYGRATDGTFEFASDGVTATVDSGGSADLVLERPGGATEPIALDVLFLLDATGSMSDEIERLKQSIDSVAERVDALEGEPDVRFTMTTYRDEGDAFVTATFDFTDDVEVFRAALADVVADGGGDYPEALDEGLAEALTVPSWRDAPEVVQLVFLVADAPPQVHRQVAVPYPDSVRDAIGRAIKVFPVASSESDDQAEAVFRQIAQATGARFVFLSYGAAGAATGGSTDIDRTDYEELALDDLVVRLIAEELALLTGNADVVPPPTPTTSTVPDGQ